MRQQQPLPDKVTFQEPPMGRVTIQAGQLGHNQKTHVELMFQAGHLCFQLGCGAVYVQEGNDYLTYHLRR